MKGRLFSLCGLAAGGFLSILFLTPDVVVAQADKVKSSMAALIAKTGALGRRKSKDSGFDKREEGRWLAGDWHSP